MLLYPFTSTECVAHQIGLLNANCLGKNFRFKNFCSDDVGKGSTYVEIFSWRLWSMSCPLPANQHHLLHCTLTYDSVKHDVHQKWAATMPLQHNGSMFKILVKWFLITISTRNLIQQQTNMLQAGYGNIWLLVNSRFHTYNNGSYL